MDEWPYIRNKSLTVGLEEAGENLKRRKRSNVISRCSGKNILLKFFSEVSDCYSGRYDDAFCYYDDNCEKPSVGEELGRAR